MAEDKAPQPPASVPGQPAPQSQREAAIENFQALSAWVSDPNRKPAHLAFTSGGLRDAATAMETFLVKPASQTAHGEQGGKSSAIIRLSYPPEQGWRGMTREKSVKLVEVMLSAEDSQ